MCLCVGASCVANSTIKQLISYSANCFLQIACRNPSPFSIIHISFDHFHHPLQTSFKSLAKIGSFPMENEGKPCQMGLFRGPTVACFWLRIARNAFKRVWAYTRRPEDRYVSSQLSLVVGRLELGSQSKFSLPIRVTKKICETQLQNDLNRGHK